MLHFQEAKLPASIVFFFFEILICEVLLDLICVIFNCSHHLMGDPVLSIKLILPQFHHQGKQTPQLTGNIAELFFVLIIGMWSVCGHF